MKAKLVVFLLLFNALVLAGDYVFIKWYLENKAAKAQHQATKTELAQWKNKVNTPGAAAQLKVVYKTNQFHWSQIESADYRQYIANLRSVGCPEQTIRDLVLTDVMRLYAQMRGKASVTGKAFKYWETDDKRKLRQKQLEDRDKQLAQIDKDLPAVLRELLGINYERELDKYFIDTGEDMQRLDFLAQGKRGQVLTLRDQFEGQREAVLSESGGEPLSANLIERLKKIDAEQDKALSGLLTPQEKETYDLSTSPTAERLRKELIGFNPSEAEFKEIFQRELAIDQAYAYADPKDAAAQQAKAADLAKVDQDINNLLDPTRVVDYQRAHNEDYRNLYVLAQRFDLPTSTAQSLMDMRQVAEEQKRQLMASSDVSDDKKAEALKAIQGETERTIKEVLGAKGYSEYNLTTSNWIQSLGN